VPVGKLLGRPPGKPRRGAGWRTILRWRDWSLPVKLSAVTLVPILIAVGLGVTTIANQVGRSDGYQRIDRLVALSADVRTLTDGLQGERTRTAAMLTAGTVGALPELDAARSKVDAAVKPFTDAVGRAVALEGTVAGPAKEATDQLGRIAGLRGQAASGTLEPVQSITEYTAITSALLKLDATLAAGISDDTIGGTPGALHDLQVAKEQVSLSQSFVDYGVARGNLAAGEVDQVRTAQVRLTDRVADFRAAATPEQLKDFDATVLLGDFATRDTLVKTVIGIDGTPPPQAFRQVSAPNWDQASTGVTTRLNDFSRRVGDQVTAASAKLVENSSSGAGLLAVLLFGALVLAVAVVFLITRQLLRSLRVLRASALDVAEAQLPAAVRNIQEGRAQGSDVQPVPVNSNDEIGEVARAFDAVHHQALRLATEQAAMRTGYASVFVNLSRRSQSLVQRQLQLIERLERDEEDADQLATLFQLDHLATRMRRNNENLMVLSGSEPTRRSGQPVTTTDVLRAAVSEIEQYQRVVVQPPPSARIVGHAASDLMRLIAELLDNATAFSAPETRVTVATRIADDRSLQVDILDKGIGMNEAEVAEANVRLTEAATVDLATSRRWGVCVGGGLAPRHRIGVTLHGGKDIVGVRATVSVPAELVMTPSAMEGTGPIPAHQRSQATGPGGALPRRQRPANGATRPGGLISSRSERTGRWPALDAGSQNGHVVGQASRTPSELEVSGTALFSPIPRDDEPQLPQSAQPPQVPRQAAPPAASPPPAAKPEPVADEPDAEPDIADVREGTLPSGKDLFAAHGTVLSDWWNKTASSRPEPVAPPSSETTPIFDEMLSAWFRTTTAPAKPASGEQPVAEEPEPVVERATTAEDWDFASDENWRTVQAVSQTPPSTFTPAGLPMRRRGEQLMPGSAAPAEIPGPAATPGSKPDPSVRPSLPSRDPAEVRGRLNSFQQGVNRGRKAKQDAAAPETAVPETAVPEAAEAASPTSATPLAPAPAEPKAGPAIPQARSQGRLQGQVPLESEAARPETSQSETNQSETTEPETTQSEAARTEAAQAEQTAAASPADQPKPENTPLPRRKAKPVQSAPAPPSAAFSVPTTLTGTSGDLGSTAEWTFDSDDDWRTVQATAKTAPSTFTSAGLPRRRRGEQLLPGSAGAPAAPSGPRPQRDPDDVRGRLSSFQQGIQRGRHRTAQPTEANQETLEGE
jgi:signal transduction histidine kinase